MTYQLAKFQICRLFWQVLQTDSEKHDDDVIMTSFYVVGI